MKFEILMLRSLFAACMLVCVLIFGAMVTAKPQPLKSAVQARVASLLASAPGHCALPADGVICPRRVG